MLLSHTSFNWLLGNKTDRFIGNYSFARNQFLCYFAQCHKDYIEGKKTGGL